MVLCLIRAESVNMKQSKKERERGKNEKAKNKKISP